jgi:hypothetical protein
MFHPRLRLAADRTWAQLACVLVAVLAAVTGPAYAQVAIPDVDISLVINVADVPGWLEFQNEVLGTATEKPLAVTLSARTGGGRTIVLARPRFATAIVVSARSIKIVVTGKVTGSEALRGLAGFQHAAMEIQSGAVENDLTMVYGLAAVRSQLIEFYINR